MTPRYPADLLRRPVEEASRLLALTYLDEIGRAERRLGDSADDEALHDFRVGVRRLRSCIRAYRPSLRGSVTKKMRRRLRDLTLATNPGRDTEVQLRWLQGQAEQVAAGEAEGVSWLIGRLEGRKSEAVDRVKADAARRFRKVTAKLRPRLLTFQVELGKNERARFSDVTAVLIRRQAMELAEALSRVRGMEDTAEAHAARISAKRLRYLLEPLSRRVPRVAGIIKRLKQLQDSLGNLHDMQALISEIGSTLRSPQLELGLQAVERGARQSAARSFANFEARWMNGREVPFLTRVNDLASSLLRSEAELKPAELETPKPDTGGVPHPLPKSVAGTPTAAAGSLISGSPSPWN